MEQHYLRNKRDPLNFYYLCKYIAKQGKEKKAYDMAISWLKDQSFIKAFQNVSKKHLSYSEALPLIKDWGIIQSYIVQYPVERLKLQLENEDLTHLDSFLQAFEIKRFLFNAELIELLNKVSNPKTLAMKLSVIFHQHFLSIPKLLICKIVTVGKADIEEFAKQFASVTLTISNLYLIEISRCVGYTVGQRNIKAEKKIMSDAVDPSCFIQPFYFIQKHYIAILNYP